MCFRQMLGCSARRLDVQVDRKKLKTDKAYVPNWQSAASAGAEEEYEAASTALEATIQRVWQEVLGQDRISVASDFFQIGGNSLRVSCTPLRVTPRPRRFSQQLAARTFAPEHGHAGQQLDGVAALDGSLLLQDCFSEKLAAA